MLGGLVLSGVLAAAQAGEPAEAERQIRRLAADNAACAWAVYHALRAEAGSGDLVFSPHSISTALAMTYVGARGSTASEMAAALHLAMPPEDAPAAFAALQRELGRAGGEHVAFHMANALWLDRRYELAPAYLSAVRKPFDAALEQVDFQQACEDARLAINRWVEQQTREKIRDLLGPGAVSALTRLVLVNAIYLKADWARPFDSAATRPWPFHPLAGPSRDVPMMNQTALLDAVEEAEYAAVELPYHGGRLRLLIVAPPVGRWAAFEESLGMERLSAIRAALRRQRVALGLPRFRLSPEAVALREVLEKLGMTSAFLAPAADFSGMTPAGTPADQQLCISDVHHKAFIAVDEQGTEAAAATAVVMELRASLPDEPPLTLMFDRPFLFVLYDEATGALLFLGRVTDPQAP